MTDIEQLLNKYYKKIGSNNTAIMTPTPAEKTSPEYNTKMKKQQYQRNRHQILQTLLTEIPFHLTPSQIEQTQYLIDRFNNNFREFHKNSSNETIILAFLLMQRKQTHPRLDIEKLPISKKYNLTNKKFTLIQNRLLFKIMQTTELRYSQSKYVNHEILTKNKK